MMKGATSNLNTLEKQAGSLPFSTISFVYKE